MRKRKKREETAPADTIGQHVGKLVDASLRAQSVQDALDGMRDLQRFTMRVLSVAKARKDSGMKERVRGHIAENDAVISRGEQTFHELERAIAYLMKLQESQPEDAEEIMPGYCRAGHDKGREQHLKSAT
jgi:hypothetical protein